MVKAEIPPSIFEQSQAGQKAYSLSKSSPLWENLTPPPALLRKQKLNLPEVSELGLTRHFSQLERLNMGIDTHFYPLGSCTMKLNPRINEEAASLEGFVKAHPLAPEAMVQGSLEVIYNLIERLCEICAMEGGSLAANAGAQGEFVGIRMIQAYHTHHRDEKRTKILVPDSAHGTNPASARMCGYQVVTLKSDLETGDVDLDDLKKHLNDDIAGLMLTNPNTLGTFSSNILTISKWVHECGGLLYYDGANLNPILNLSRPGKMGFDVMHINLHKTFSTPHGGGGPGGAPVLCKERLCPFLPTPWVEASGEKYKVRWKVPTSIGSISSFYGNFSVFVRALLYIQLHGDYGLRRIAEISILNANYLKHHLSGFLKVPISLPCMHEFVVQADQFLAQGIRAFDLVKRLLDYGIHAPTVYFPLIVKECLLIEPTESESKKTLDHFIHILKTIVQEIKENPECIKTAPHNTPVTRLDEVHAAKVLEVLE